MSKSDRSDSQASLPVQVAAVRQSHEVCKRLRQRKSRGCSRKEESREGGRVLRVEARLAQKGGREPGLGQSSTQLCPDSVQWTLSGDEG